jgi:hypothetical protein
VQILGFQKNLEIIDNGMKAADTFLAEIKDIAPITATNLLSFKMESLNRTVERGSE